MTKTRLCTRCEAEPPQANSVVCKKCERLMFKMLSGKIAKGEKVSVQKQPPITYKDRFHDTSRRGHTKSNMTDNSGYSASWDNVVRAYEE